MSIVMQGKNFLSLFDTDDFGKRVVQVNIWDIQVALGKPSLVGKTIPTWELPTRAGGSHRENTGTLGKGSDVGKLEGAGRDLEEGTAGKTVLFIQWTNKAAPPLITIIQLGRPGPRLTKDLGLVTATPTPPFQVLSSSSEMPKPWLLTPPM